MTSGEVLNLNTSNVINKPHNLSLKYIVPLNLNTSNVINKLF